MTPSTQSPAVADVLRNIGLDATAHKIANQMLAHHLKECSQPHALALAIRAYLSAAGHSQDETQCTCAGQWVNPGCRIHGEFAQSLASTPAVSPAPAERIKMADVRVGMRLRPTPPSITPEVVVTEITSKGFKYQHAPVNLGHRIGVMEGGEHYGFDGYAYFSLVPDLAGTSRPNEPEKGRTGEGKASPIALNLAFALTRLQSTGRTK